MRANRCVGNPCVALDSVRARFRASEHCEVSRLGEAVIGPVGFRSPEHGRLIHYSLVAAALFDDVDPSDQSATNGHSGLVASRHDFGLTECFNVLG
jgi:hypothetical protein